MSYVGDPYEHDIFMSYSHGDVDGNGDSKLRNWSQAFARELESELKALPGIGRDIRLFLDQHHRPDQGLDPTEPLSDQLREDIRLSAVLGILMSPHYLDSDWCQREREWWFQAQSALNMSAEGRKTIARIWPTEKQWPPELCDSEGEPDIGFTFYDKSRKEIRPQPFEWPEPETNSKGDFRDALLDMVGRLRLNLDEIKDRVDLQRQLKTEAGRLSAPAGQVVYLHGRASQSELWEKTNEALTQQGLVVFPSDPDPVGGNPASMLELRNTRVEIMGGCDALLLLGTKDQRATEADLVVVGRQDRHAARATSNRHLPCALLDNADTDSGARHKIAARGLQIDWIDATGTTWPVDVRDWLNQSGHTLVAAG